MIDTVSGVFLRDLFGWRAPEVFSPEDHERERPEATVYAS
jgi:hypothetical protein